MRGSLEGNGLLVVIEDPTKPIIPHNSSLPPSLPYSLDSSYSGVKILYPSTIRRKGEDIEIFPDLEQISIEVIKTEAEKNPELKIQIGTQEITWGELNDILKTLNEEGNIKKGDHFLNVETLFQAREASERSDQKLSIIHAINQTRLEANDVARFQV